jgi:hypothetical protein
MAYKFLRIYLFFRISIQFSYILILQIQFSQKLEDEYIKLFLLHVLSYHCTPYLKYSSPEIMLK